MIAPKINGQSMQEIYSDYEDNYGSWLASFGSGMIEIRVLENGIGKCTYRITYDTVPIGGYDYSFITYENPQEAANEAVKYLNKLSNLLNNYSWKI